MLALGTVIPVLQYRPPLDIFLNVDDGFIIAGGRKNSIWDFFEKKSHMGWMENKEECWSALPWIKWYDSI